MPKNIIFGIFRRLPPFITNPNATAGCSLHYLCLRNVADAFSGLNIL